MSAKDHCGHHDDDDQKKLKRRIIASLLSLISLILFVILLIYLILRPTNPHFTLQDLTLYAFNLSATSATLTTNLQITFSSRNPNARIGIFYDKLHVYASYRSQQITLSTLIPPTYQGHKDVTVWSPYLYGNDVPVAPYLTLSLGQDETAGTVLVNIKGSGRVRWKVGNFVSGGYRLNINCPAYITFGNKPLSIDPAVKYQLVERCTVDV